MKVASIKVTEIKDYLDIAKKEVEIRWALNNYERLKALLKCSREDIKKQREEFNTLRKKCIHYKPSPKLIDELAQTNNWK